MRARMILGFSMLLLACAALISGCSRIPLEYVESGSSYTSATALALAGSVEPGAIADHEVAESSGLRTSALGRLRSQTGSAADVAELITRIFPPDTAAVPFYIERGSYEGKRAILIVEAIGRPGGRLTDERVWVLSESGDVLLTGTR